MPKFYVEELMEVWRRYYEIEADTPQEAADAAAWTKVDETYTEGTGTMEITNLETKKMYRTRGYKVQED